MAKRLVAAHGRRLAALALLGAFCACATTSGEPRPEARPAGWRIVERIGEARFSPPGAATWLSATIGETLAEGSEVATGRGGRLIVDAPGRHISVGPDSRFVLPDRHRDDRLEQRAGWLRYRIAAAAAQPFRIHTRSLELELLAGVVDVHVDHLATEVTVKEGQVRVATPDGLRETQMMAGQSAHAGGSADTQLAVRLAPGAQLEPVDRVIVPALHPKASPTERPGASAPTRPPRAELPAPRRIDRATTPPADRAAPEAPLAPRRAAASREASPLAAVAAAPQPRAEMIAATRPEVVTLRTPERPTPPAGRRPNESQAAATRGGMFERLTAGMLDQVEPRHHSQVLR